MIAAGRRRHRHVKTANVRKPLIKPPRIGVGGIRTRNLLRAKQALSQLELTPRITSEWNYRIIGSAGVEPATTGFKVRCATNCTTTQSSSHDHGRARTFNLLLRRQALFPLSYAVNSGMGVSLMFIIKTLARQELNLQLPG